MLYASILARWLLYRDHHRPYVPAVGPALDANNEEYETGVTFVSTYILDEKLPRMSLQSLALGLVWSDTRWVYRGGSVSIRLEVRSPPWCGKIHCISVPAILLETI